MISLKRSLVVMALIIGLTGLALADEATTATSSMTADSASAEQAKAALDKMSRYYAGLDQAEVKASLSIIADVHAKPELFGNTFLYAFKRPNLYFRELRNNQDGNAMVSQIISGGENTTYYHGEYNLYTVQEQPLDFKKTLNTDDPPISGTLDIMTLFAYLLQSDPAAAIMQNAENLKLAGTENVNGAEMVKLELTLNDAATELWIMAGDKPLLARARIDVSNQIPVRGLPPNTPLRALIEFSDWKTEGVDGARFTFVPPAGSEQRGSTDDIMKEGVLKQVAEESKKHALVGKPAPAVALPLFDGGQFNLADHKDKDVVVLDFWATWCTPCAISMPMMIDVTNQYKDKGVKFIAINQQQEKEVIQQFLTKQKISPVVALDSSLKVSREYGAGSIPFTVIVGKDGLVKRVHQGTLRDQDLARKLLVKEVEDVLAGK